MRPWAVGDKAQFVWGTCKFTPGVVAEVIEFSDGRSFAKLVNPITGHFNMYPTNQLKPVGLTALTFRHAVYTFLELFHGG